MAERSLTMKLLIDTTTNKVLFAEAGKEEVDFLSWLLTLPLGTVVKLLGKENMVGSLGTMYGSLERLDSTYFQDTNKKNLLLHPKVLSSCSSSTHNTLPLLLDDTLAGSYYLCNYCSDGFYTDISGTRCPSCNREMTTMLMKNVDQGTVKGKGNAKVEGEGAGYVKGVVTYTVMDDLTVTPMSTISSITLLNKFNVRSVDLLREETVNLGMQERLELLRFSLQSKNVLTKVFLEKDNVNNIVLDDVLPEMNNVRLAEKTERASYSNFQ